MSQLTQQNLPVLQFAQGPLNLPAEVAARMAATYDSAFAGLGSQGMFRRIRVGKVGFILQDGQNKETVPFDQLFGVFVGAAPSNHAVWWSKSFTPGQEPEEPDLCWMMPTMDTFPEALPLHLRKKIVKNGREVWDFTIMRRVAFILMRNIGGQMVLDMDRPYIMDLTSMSLFGKGMPEQNMYKWSGLRDMCSQNSTAQMQIMPSMFLTKILVDVNAPSGVVMFMPMRDPATQHLQIFHVSLLMAIDDCAQRQSTRDMLVVREKLTLGAAITVPSPTAGQVVNPVFVQPQPTTQQAPAIVPPTGVPVMPGSFNTATLPPPVQQYPSSVVQTPVQVPTPAGADMSTLLQQAQMILNQQAATTVPPASVPPVQTIPDPALAPQASATPPPSVPTVTDPSVQANIANLMAQLGG